MTGVEVAIRSDQIWPLFFRDWGSWLHELIILV